MKIFDANISGSLNVSGAARFFGDLQVDGTINATISGTTSNASALNTTGSARFATTGSNVFNASQTISGSLYVTTDIVLNGQSYTGQTSGTSGTSGSSGSNGSSGTAGTSGSSGSNGSSGTSVSVSGTNNKVVKFTSASTVGNSNITDDGTTIQLGSNTQVTGSLTVTGNLIAQQYIVSNSITYLTTSFQSGSSAFGNSLDDTHNFTGSVNITGSLSLNGSTVGTGKLDTTAFNTYTSSVSSTFAGTASFATTASYAANAVVVSGITKTYTVSSPSTTWSFNHGLGQRYPSVEIYDTDGFIVIPSNIQSVDTNNLNVFFSIAQSGTLSVTLGGAGTAGTSGTSGTSGRDGLGGFSQTYTASVTWSVPHNLGMDYPVLTVWGTDRKVVIPTEVHSIDTNNIKVYFSQSIAGTISVIKIL